MISSGPPAGDRVRRDTSVMLVVGASAPSPGNPPKPPKEQGDKGKHLGKEKD